MRLNSLGMVLWTMGNDGLGVCDVEASTGNIPNIKRREIVNRYLDSRPWNDFSFRDGDVIIATYAKSGTTWMQQIVSQLVFDGAGIWIFTRSRPGSTCAPSLRRRVMPSRSRRTAGLLSRTCHPMR